MTFTGSLIASGKLQGLITGKPIIVPGGRIVTVALAAIAVARRDRPASARRRSTRRPADRGHPGDHRGLGLVFGVTMVLPIGGADMPVVIAS